MDRSRRSAALAVIAVALATFATGQPVAAAGATMTVDPATQTVSQGSTFTVHIVEHNSGVIAGIQASLAFDKTQLQIQSVTKGSAVASAPIWVPASGFSDVISRANSGSKLAQIAAAFISPPGLAAGDQDFLDVIFQATGCGTVALNLPVGLTDAQVTDGSDPNNWGGNTVPVTTTAGSVTIDSCSGSGGGSDGGGSQATQGNSGQTGAAPGSGGDTTGGNTQAGGAGSTQFADAGGAGSANQTAQVNGGGNATTSGTGTTGSAGRTLPLTVPIIVAIPAVAVIWLGLRKWRLAEIQ